MRNLTPNQAYQARCNAEDNKTTGNQPRCGCRLDLLQTKFVINDEFLLAQTTLNIEGG